MLIRELVMASTALVIALAEYTTTTISVLVCVETALFFIAQTALVILAFYIVFCLYVSPIFPN